MADCAGPRAVECHTGRVPMSQPKPAAIFDHCQHCGVITVWQYRVDNRTPVRKAGITGVRIASVAASRPTNLPNVSPRLSPTLTIMNRTRRSIVEMDLRPVVGRVGIDPGAHAHYWGGRPRGIGGVGCRRCGPGARVIGRHRRRSSPAALEMGTICQMVRSGGPLQQPGNDGLPNHPTRQRGAAVRAGMAENRSYEMSVEMLSPLSAAELTRRVQYKGSPVKRSIRCSEYPRRPNRRPPGQAAHPSSPHEGRSG